MIIWMTGLSGAGKTTIANGLSSILNTTGQAVIILDGDDLRKGINADLGFSREDRRENIRRIAELANLLSKFNVIIIVAVICPYNEDRCLVNRILQNTKLINIYIKCSIQLCEGRDPKGLYKKAKNGEIKEFTGVSAPFEEPLYADLIVNTEKLSIQQSADCIINYLKEVKKAMH